MRRVVKIERDFKTRRGGQVSKRFNIKMIIGVGALMLAMAQTTFGIQGQLAETNYGEAVAGVLYEDRGVVLENYPMLGYLVYRNGQGQRVTAKYYSREMIVEKKPYDEAEDRIGYIDELFPHFNYDARDTTIEHLWPGDSIYLRMDQEGYISYISAFSNYIVRYGKVHTHTLGAESMVSIVLEEESGRLHRYTVPVHVPVTKGNRPYSMGQLKEGEWVRLLVNQQLLGHGVVEETVREIVVDPDSRMISGIYRGELLSINTHRQLMTLKNKQQLQPNGWGAYEAASQLSINPRVVRSYFLGQEIGFDQVAKRMPSAGGYVYVALEQNRGYEQAVKLNFQSNKQRYFPPTLVTYTSPGVIQLLTGERLFLAEDTLLVRDNRLIGPASLMGGETIQGVVSGENKLAVGQVVDTQSSGLLQVFRGRIREIDDGRTFEVETFSLLDNGQWYFHPSPRTFAIDHDTWLFGEQGIVSEGIDQFLTYGEHNKEQEVYTAIVKGDRAVALSDMAYTKESIKGEVYATANGIQLKKVAYYNNQRKRYETLSPKGQTVNLEALPYTLVLKEGKLVSTKSIQSGDRLTVMMEKPIELSESDTNTLTPVNVPAYIIIVD